MIFGTTKQPGGFLRVSVPRATAARPPASGVTWKLPAALQPDSLRRVLEKKRVDEKKKQRDRLKIALGYRR